MEKQTLNFFRWIVFTTILPYLNIIPFVPFYLYGFSLRGWAWMIMLIVAVITLLTGKRITIPLWVWLPFVVYILGYNLFDFSFLGVQLSFQYLVSILVGYAASTLIYTDWVIDKLYQFAKQFIVVFFTICFISLLLYQVTPFSASTVMTLTVFASLFLCYYFNTKNWIGIIGYVCCLFFPVYMVTRTGAVAVLLVAIGHFANRNFIKKGFVIAVIGFLGIAIFNLKAFQEKNFGKVGGSIEDLNYGNKHFNTNGRIYLYSLLTPGLEESPVWGNGPRADLKLLENKGLKVKEVHNDYLAVRYNYGYVGLGLMLFGFIALALLMLYHRNDIQDKFTYWMYTSAMTLFLPFFTLMYTDNILKYSIFFGNFQFAMIGIVFSRLYWIRRYNLTFRKEEAEDPARLIENYETV
ncbi:MAG: hypothetical protein Q8909_12160 [Bacteroidota bacterium]|nr:hypothetical protein [Bacteroidota bacterium]